jgi:hypothetical protein
MKTILFILISLTILALSCSQSTEPLSTSINADTKIEMLKRIFQLEVNNHWKYQELSYYQRTGENLISWNTEEEFYQVLLNDDCDITLLRIGILSLSTGSLPETDNILLDFLDHEDGLVSLNAARALAYRDKQDGLEILQDCASAKIGLTSSSFEMNWAALALLILDVNLPQEYLEWQFADPLYIKLDKI